MRYWLLWLWMLSALPCYAGNFEIMQSLTNADSARSFRELSNFPADELRRFFLEVGFQRLNAFSKQTRVDLVYRIGWRFYSPDEQQVLMGKFRTELGVKEKADWLRIFDSAKVPINPFLSVVEVSELNGFGAELLGTIFQGVSVQDLGAESQKRIRGWLESADPSIQLTVREILLTRDLRSAATALNTEDSDRNMAGVSFGLGSSVVTVMGAAVIGGLNYFFSIPAGVNVAMGLGTLVAGFGTGALVANGVGATVAQNDRLKIEYLKYILGAVASFDGEYHQDLASLAGSVPLEIERFTRLAGNHIQLYFPTLAEIYRRLIRIDEKISASRLKNTLNAGHLRALLSTLDNKATTPAVDWRPPVHSCVYGFMGYEEKPPVLAGDFEL